ncbi:hypothetical protein JMF89_16510 [Clostridiaceae bacterium UIB06]|nr:hypothetical protein [Clostridiaceae bacterium UIB06]
MNNLKEIRVPQVGVNDDLVTICELMVENADVVKKNQEIIAIETSKSSAHIESEFDGYIYILVEEGEDVKIGDTIAIVSEVCDDNTITKYKESKKINKKYEDSDKEIRITDKAKKLALDNNIDLNMLPNDKIIREKDILELIENNTKKQDIKNIFKGNMELNFIKAIEKDEHFKGLASELKVEIYKRFGADIEEGVIIKKGSIILSEDIHIRKNTIIDTNSYIESRVLIIGENSNIGKNNDWVADSIVVGNDLRSASDVKIDVSGGKSYESRLTIGEKCLLCENVYINVCRSVDIGNQVCLSPRAMIFTHRYWQSILDGYDAKFSNVIIKDNSWIGGGAQVMAGVSIGKGVVAMANSVLISDVEDRVLVGGVPAQKIKEIKEEKFSFIKKIKNVSEFLDMRLKYIGYDTTVNNNENYITMSLNFNNKDFKIIFCDLDYSFYNNEDYGILVCNNFDNTLFQSSNFTIFDVGNRKVIGETNVLTDEVKNSLRRFGITF